MVVETCDNAVIYNMESNDLYFTIFILQIHCLNLFAFVCFTHGLCEIEENVKMTSKQNVTWQREREKLVDLSIAIVEIVNRI